MDIKNIEEIALVLLDSKSKEITISSENTSICIKRSFVKNGRKAVVKAESKENKQKLSIVVTSNLVGVFHFSENGFRIGDIINKGDIIGYINAFKINNDVISQVSGKITEILVEDSCPVEYGQILLVLE